MSSALEKRGTCPSTTNRDSEVRCFPGNRFRALPWRRHPLCHFRGKCFALFVFCGCEDPQRCLSACKGKLSLSHRRIRLQMMTGPTSSLRPSIWANQAMAGHGSSLVRALVLHLGTRSRANWARAHMRASGSLVILRALLHLHVLGFDADEVFGLAPTPSSRSKS
jgi:hypothetical protein